MFNGSVWKYYPERGKFYLPAEKDIPLNDDGITWTKITTMIGTKLRGFKVEGNTLIKTGISGTFLFTGVSNLKINKTGAIFYGLGLNGTVIEGETTEHTFPNANAVSTISITSLADLKPGDEIEIYARNESAATGVIITIGKLDVTFLGGEK